MSETGQPVSRGTLYIKTHMRFDGTYINDEARVICEKIAEIERKGTAPMEISPIDSLGLVFGREHSGRVRGVGDGVFPTQVFGSRSRRFCGTCSGSNNATDQSRVAHLENEVQELKTTLNAKDRRMNKIESLLAQLLKKSSMPVPSDLTTDLDEELSDDEYFGADDQY